MGNGKEYDKPFKSDKELIELLKTRNVIFKNEEKALQDISDFSYYYLINGYKSYFEKDNDIFKETVDFNMIKMVSVLDTDLNNIILKYIIYVERSLISKISTTISAHYGVETFLDDSIDNKADYFCKDNYSSVPERNNVLRDVKKCIVDNKYKNNSLKHYVKNHNHIPPWIALNTLLFGKTILLYKILKPVDKNYVCNNIVNTNKLNENEMKEFLFKALNNLKEFRNSVAHGQKIITSSKSDFYDKNVFNRLTNNKVSKNEYSKKYGNYLLFNVLIALCVLLRNDIKQFYVNEISTFLIHYSKYDFNSKSIIEILNLPDDIVNILNTID